MEVKEAIGKVLAYVVIAGVGVFVVGLGAKCITWAWNWL